MSLDISKLENVRQRAGKTTAQCPACAEAGHDRRGEHLFIGAEGHWGCVVYPGDTADARDHRTRIFVLCGSREVKPLAVKHAGLGRLGRVGESHSVGAPLKTGLLGRLGRVFETHLKPERDQREDQDAGPQPDDRARGVRSVPITPAAASHRPLAEHERELLRTAGAENEPLVFAVLRIFNARVIECEDPRCEVMDARASGMIS